MTPFHRVAFAMKPERTEHVFTQSALDRLSRICDIIDPAPLETFGDGRAADILGQTDILITGWGCDPIDGTVLAAAPNVKLIAHAAGTVKGMLSEEVFQAGIAVTHAAEANALPVAEFTLAAILFANKRIFHFRDLYRTERGRRRSAALMREPMGNYRRVVGIVGASRIGRRVVELLKPFDLSILLYDPFVSDSEAGALGVRLVALDELMARSDVVSIHAPALPSTRAMIDAHRLRLMRDGTTLINTARGVIVDESALVAELRTGRIEAIIDVTHPEVPAPDSALYELPNVFLTPHVAGAIGLERARLGEYVIDEIERYISGRPLLSAIEAAALERMA
jgi:phosphoglycerate dehydrogenase-like enzyme